MMSNSSLDDINELQLHVDREESTCRFCSAELPDWKASFPPSRVHRRPVQPLMAVALNGVIHQIPVKSGPGAMEEFTAKIRELFNIGPEAEIDVSFVCKVPCGSG